MLFNSKEFALFFIIVCGLYWLAFRWRDVQNGILLAASMFFYSRLHYSFPIYLASLIIVSYLFANMIEKTEHEQKRKWLMRTSVIIISFGLLYTKYSGFLLNNVKGLEQWQASALHILVPVGISFYTFAILGYLMEVYYEVIPAQRNLNTYATYISFFPNLLSGPISSARTILPQFSQKPTINLAMADEAVGEFLWGLFKKMVVADNISLAVSFCFASNNFSDLNGSSMYIGAVLYVVQVYADFSGYSSMARGCAKILGINLTQNFNMPLFSRSVTDYWRRWHISLTSWFNSYIYNPLVFSFKSWRKWGIATALLITFFISGFWHGAGWQYIIFGMLNGVALVYELFTKDFREKAFRTLPAFLNALLSTFFVFNFMILAAVFFRAKTVADACTILGMICSKSFLQLPNSFVFKYIYWIIPLLVVEWIQRKGTYAMDIMQWLPTKVTAKDAPRKTNITRVNILIKVVLYLLLSVSIYLFYKKQNMAEYYYFKF